MSKNELHIFMFVIIKAILKENNDKHTYSYLQYNSLYLKKKG